MIELLWLLLPVAAASGWLAAKRSTSISANPSVFKLPSDYLKGLNYLLNEEPDKAIDIFIKLIDVDDDTFETHLALGILFRRRGEVNRAIRIHQNLIARPHLNATQHGVALLELARDYQRAGLLDRAEHLFTELAHYAEHSHYAYTQLLDIYQQEHDWDKALDTAQHLARDAIHPTMHRVIAQYHCERAENHHQQQQDTEATNALQQALDIDPKCVRASLLQGHYSLEKNELEQAITAFRRVEQQDADYLAEVIEPLQTCYQRAGRCQEFQQYLQHILSHYNGITPLIVMARILEHPAQPSEKTNFIIRQLHKRASLRSLDTLLKCTLEQPNLLTTDFIRLLQDITTQLLKNKPVYKCHHCGFTGRTLHWCCPSCKQWNTIKPIEGTEN